MVGTKFPLVLFPSQPLSLQCDFICEVYLYVHYHLVLAGALFNVSAAAAYISTCLKKWLHLRNEFPSGSSISTLQEVSRLLEDVNDM